MKDLKKILLIFSIKQKKNLFFLILAIICGAFLEMFSIAIILPFLKLLSGDGYPDFLIKLLSLSWFVNLNKQQIIIFFLLFILFLFYLKNLFLTTVTWYQHRFSIVIGRELSIKIMEINLKKNYFDFIKSDKEMNMKTVSHDISFFCNSLTAINYIVLDSLIIFFLLIFLIYIQPIGSLILICIFFFSTKFYLKYLGKKIQNWAKIRQISERNKLASVNQSFAGIRDIKLNNSINFFLDIFKISNLNFTEALFKNSFVQAITKFVIEILAITSFASFLIIIIYNGDIEVVLPIVGLFTASAFKILPSLNRIINSKQQIKFIQPVIDNLVSQVNLYHELEKVKNIDEKNTVIKFFNAIEFKDVFFNYYENNNVLNNLNIKIPLDKNIGIIGKNGSGKSTFLDLFSGLLEPTRGQIIINNFEIIKIKSNWQSSIAYVSQNSFLINDSILNNIRFGRSISDNKIEKIIEDSTLDDFVYNLKEGLNTIVGDNGVKLSGGQKQRLLIARALYGSPKILILDEATNAIDKISEAKLTKNIQNLSKNKEMKILAVSHSSKIFSICDLIYEIKDKNIFLINRNISQIIK